MRIAIYQPRYFPQLHYFNRLLSVDTFVILDNAQYTKALTHKNGDTLVREKSYQSDTPVRLPHGEMLLTVPVMHNGYLPINQTRIDYHQKWSLKHVAYLKAGYQKAAYFHYFYPRIKRLLAVEFPTLAELNITTILWMLAYLMGAPLSLSTCTVENINSMLQKKTLRLKKILLGKDMKSLRPEGLHKGTEWTVAICQELGATEYMHGKTAKENYMNEAAYAAAGIQTVMQEWHCASYPQQFQKKMGFSPNLSILDLVCNTSLHEARNILGMT